MPCIEELKLYFVIFFLFGHASYIPSKLNHHKRIKVLSIFLKIINVSIPLCGAIVILFDRSHSFEVENLNSFTVKYSVIAHYSMATFALYTSIITPNLSCHLCEFFAGIIQYMERHLKIVIQIHTFKQMFLRKLMLKMFIEALAAAFRLRVMDLFVNPSETILMTITLNAIISGAFHVVLYICLIEFLLFSITAKLNDHLSASKRFTRIDLLFRHLKWIHYNLWKISQIISRKFGLLLAVLLLDYSLTFVITIYRIFVFWPSINIASK